MSNSRKSTFLPPASRLTSKKITPSLNVTTMHPDKSDNLHPKKLPPKLNATKMDVSKLNQTTNSTSSVASSRVDGSSSKVYEDLEKKLAFNDYLEALFVDALIEEKIESEKSEVDVKMAELAMRLEINKVILEKTDSRLKEIAFLSEQQRIINRQNADMKTFDWGLEDASSPATLQRLTSNSDLYCDRIDLKRVDMGYQSGRLDSAVRQTSEALERTSGSYRTMGLSAEASEGLDRCDKAVADIEKALKECLDVLPAAGAKLVEGVSDKMVTALC